MSNVGKGYVTHHACQCYSERSDRIEVVWQKFKHLDKVIMDNVLRDDRQLKGYILKHLWQAIRRD